MGPLYTVLLCLPAGLALIISVCGLAILRSRRQGARRPTQARGRMDRWEEVRPLFDGRDGLLSHVCLRQRFIPNPSRSIYQNL